MGRQNFALFNVAPEGAGGALDELLYLMAGNSQGEATWTTADVVALLSDRFSGEFLIKGCAGAFLTSAREEMAEAVLDIAVLRSSVQDNSRFYRGGANGTIYQAPSAYSHAVLLQGFAYAGDFCQIARYVSLKAESDMTTSDIISHVRRESGFSGEYLAFVLGIAGSCTVRAAYSHPTFVQSSPVSMFEQYAHVTVAGIHLMYGVVTPSDYTKFGGHSHGFSLTGISGGHLTAVSKDACVSVWVYQPTEDEIFYLTY